MKLQNNSITSNNNSQSLSLLPPPSQPWTTTTAKKINNLVVDYLYMDNDLSYVPQYTAMYIVSYKTATKIFYKTIFPQISFIQKIDTVTVNIIFKSETFQPFCARSSWVGLFSISCKIATVIIYKQFFVNSREWVYAAK